MHETEHSKPVHWDNPEGWNGKRGGRVVQDCGGRGGTCTPVADSFQCMAKKLHCQEAFNKRLPVCCFGSVRNSLFLIKN